MNIDSEIQYFTELAYIDKARLLNLFLHELAEAARATYGPAADQVHDALHLRFANELVHRLTRLVEQLLAPRIDKVAERWVYDAYGRAIRGFESYDTTVLMNS